MKKEDRSKENPVFGKFSYEEIAEITGVSLPTVYNWKKYGNMPSWAIIALGSKIV